MAELVLIRHASVVVDAMVPPSQWQLDDQGRRLCRGLASALRMHTLDLLVSSESRKAIETAEIVAKRLRIETRTAPDLDEHRRPYVEPPAEFERLVERFFAEPDQRVFGEERATEALARFEAAIDAVLANEPGRRVGIVTHGAMIALYTAPVLGIGAAALWQRMQAPSFVVVDVDERRVVRIVDEIE